MTGKIDTFLRRKSGLLTVTRPERCIIVFKQSEQRCLNDFLLSRALREIVVDDMVIVTAGYSSTTCILARCLLRFVESYDGL